MAAGEMPAVEEQHSRDRQTPQAVEGRLVDDASLRTRL
jgi:hypothetical protein